MKAKPGDNFDSEDEEVPGAGFLSKQESGNMQNINGQEFDVIDVGEAMQPQSQEPADEGANGASRDRRGAIDQKKA